MGIAAVAQRAVPAAGNGVYTCVSANVTANFGDLCGGRLGSDVQ